MPASKLKNLAIIILLLCNVFLLILVVPARWESRQQQNALRDQLVALYDGYGLSLPEGRLPEGRELYLLEAQYDADAALAAARALLGEQVLSESDSGSYQTSYTSSRGACTIRRDSLNAKLTDGSAVNGSLRTATRRTLGKMGFAIDTLSSPVSEGGENLVTARQSIAGSSVFSCELVFRYRAGVLQSVSGGFCPAAETLTAIGSEKSISCADALVAFLNALEQTGWVGSAITGIEQGYLLAESAGASTVQLIPVWQLSTDTGVFYVNGITRDVTAAAS